MVVTVVPTVVFHTSTVVFTVVPVVLPAEAGVEPQGCRRWSLEYDGKYDGSTTVNTTAKALPGLGYDAYDGIFPIRRSKQYKKGGEGKNLGA